MPEPSQPKEVTVSLTLSARTVARLKALADPEWTTPTVETVLYELIDHAQQAVYRPGSWERPWICQAFGEGWLANLEDDPDAPEVHGQPWQRPRRTDG